MGVDHSSVQFPERYSLYESFRKRAASVLAYDYTEVHEDFDSTTTNPIRVVVIQRLDSRRFSIDTLAEMKRTIFGVLPEAVVDVILLENSTLRDQAILMQGASIVIVVDGAAVDNLLFAPPCSGLLVIGRDIEHPLSFDLEHGFFMHETHFHLWQQWLSIELFHTSRGSWMSLLPNGKPAGALGWLPHSNDLRIQFISHFKRVLNKRKDCSLRFLREEKSIVNGDDKAAISIFDECANARVNRLCPTSMDSTVLCCIPSLQTKMYCYDTYDDVVVCTNLEESNSQSFNWYPYVSRHRFVAVPEKVLTYEDYKVEEMNYLIVRVELSPNPPYFSTATRSEFWYSFSDFSSQTLKTPVKYFSQLYDILIPLSDHLFRKKRVAVYNAIDAFVPILALLKGATMLDTYLPSEKDDVGLSNLIGKLSPLFTDSCRFGGKSFYGPAYADSKSADTVVVMLGLHDLFPCYPEKEIIFGSSKLSYFEAIKSLSRQTMSSLFLEFHPSEGYRGSSIHPEIKLLEEALRYHFISFKVAGVIQDGSSSGTFFYFAEKPIIMAVDDIVEQPVQVVIVQPLDKSTYALIGDKAVISIEGVITGPSQHLIELHEKSKFKNTVGTYLTPRLFVNRMLQDNNSVTYSFSGSNLLFSYLIDIHMTGKFNITLQLLRDTKKRFKSQLLVPELASQHSIQITIATQHP